MVIAFTAKKIPVLRALATYAERTNWVQIYDGKTSDGPAPHACMWAFVGPVIPPYELAQQALSSPKSSEQYWVIEVPNWGTLHAIGSEEEAEQWRRHKANWEHSIARKRLATQAEIENGEITWYPLAKLICDH